MDLPMILSCGERLKSAFFAVSQPRTDYQLKKFVVEEHESPERQYMQIVVELQRKYSALRRAVVTRRQKEKELETKTDLDERELIAIDLEEMDFAMTGAMREFATLYTMLQQYPVYTAEQLQAAEESYWHRRLTRQAQIDLDSMGTVSAGNLDALRQAGIMDQFKLQFQQNNAVPPQQVYDALRIAIPTSTDTVGGT